jgi:hypothetical protein
MSQTSGDRFKVTWSEKNREAVKQLAKKAVRLGLTASFREALEIIVERLASEPLTWGDPAYRLRKADWKICHGISAPLHVFFGVDEDRRIVFIKEIAALPGHGLADPIDE